jgi:hypothetical protein
MMMMMMVVVVMVVETGEQPLMIYWQTCERGAAAAAA